MFFFFFLSSFLATHILSFFIHVFVFLNGLSFLFFLVLYFVSSFFIHYSNFCYFLYPYIFLLVCTFYSFSFVSGSLSLATPNLGIIICSLAVSGLPSPLFAEMWEFKLTSSHPALFFSQSILLLHVNILYYFYISLSILLPVFPFLRPTLLV